MSVKVTSARTPTWVLEPSPVTADRLIVAYQTAKKSYLKNSTAMAFAGWIVEEDAKRAPREANSVGVPPGFGGPHPAVADPTGPFDLTTELYAAQRNDFRFCREAGAENYQITFLRHLPYYPKEWRPICLPKDWLQPDIRSLALEIREARAWELLPMFSDRFQDAGCDDVPVLNHLRGDPDAQRFPEAAPPRKVVVEGHAACWSCAVVELVLASWECYEYDARKTEEREEEVRAAEEVGKAPPAAALLRPYLDNPLAREAKEIAERAAERLMREAERRVAEAIEGTVGEGHY